MTEVVEQLPRLFLWVQQPQCLGLLAGLFSSEFGQQRRFKVATKQFELHDASTAARLRKPTIFSDAITSKWREWPFDN